MSGQGRPREDRRRDALQGQDFVHHPEGESWVRAYEAELEAFPEAPHDDQVDAASGAFNETAKPGPRIRAVGR